MNPFDKYNQMADVIDPMQWAESLKSQKPKKDKKKGRGGFLTSLISEGGAIGGGALGASIGTGILPGIGTLLGGALGSGIGAFTGRVAENKVRDDRLGLGDAAKEGALSTVLGGGPIRIAKGAITAGKAVKGGANLTDAIVEAGNKAVGMNTKKAVGKKLTASGEGLIAKEFRLTPSQQANYAKLHGEEATKTLRNYGIKKPEEIADRIQPLQNAFDGVVDKIPSAGKNEISDALQKVYEPLLKSPVLTRQQLGQQIKSQADEILTKSGDTLSASELNTLRKSFDEAVSYTQRGTNEYTVNKKSADAIRKLLQTKADSAGITVDGKTFKDVGLELRKLRNLDEVVNKQSYLGTGSLPISIGNLPGAGIGGVAGGLPGAVAGYALNSAVNSPAGRRVITNGTLNVGEKLTGAAAKSSPYGVAGISGRVLPAAAVSAAVGIGSQSEDSNSTQQTTPTIMNSANQLSTTNISTLNQTNGNVSSSASPFAPANLESAIQQILSNGGTIDDANKFISLAGSLQKLQATGAGAPLSAEAARTISNANTGLQALDDFEAAIAADPSVLAKRNIPGRDALGGLIGGIAGTRGIDAAAQQIIDVIARLRTGAAITNDEARRFAQFIPTSSDPEDVRLQKINYLRGQFSGVANRSGSTGSDLESAILSTQGV